MKNEKYIEVENKGFWNRFWYGRSYFKVNPKWLEESEKEFADKLEQSRTNMSDKTCSFTNEKCNRDCSHYYKGSFYVPMPYWCEDGGEYCQEFRLKPASCKLWNEQATC